MSYLVVWQYQEPETNKCRESRRHKYKNNPRPAPPLPQKLFPHLLFPILVITNFLQHFLNILFLPTNFLTPSLGKYTFLWFHTIKLGLLYDIHITYLLKKHIH